MNAQVVLLVYPDAHRARRVDEDATGLGPVASQTRRQLYARIWLAEKKPLQLQLRFLLGLHAFGHRFITVGALKWKVLALELARQSVESTDDDAFNVAPLLPRDGSRETELVQVARGCQTHRDHMSSRGVDGLRCHRRAIHFRKAAADSARRKRCQCAAEGHGSPDGALPQHGTEEALKDLVTSRVASHSADHANHRVATIVHRRLDALGEADAKVRPHQPELFVNLRMLAENFRHDARMKGKVRQRLWADVGWETWHFFVAQAWQR
mmetsp:Transcript_37428/g.102850  ORF Transcript_37428/g.102850 Transcript_37428/m.102850 type:complete len:267 (+) Transcript_37428:672-1472(+)